MEPVLEYPATGRLAIDGHIRGKSPIPIPHAIHIGFVWDAFHSKREFAPTPNSIGARTYIYTGAREVLELLVSSSPQSGET